MKRIVVVITARPSYGRIKSALEAMRHRGDLDLLVVTAASANLDKYGNVAAQIERDGFEIADRVYSVLEGSSVEAMVKATSLTAMELASVFRRLQPGMVVTIADRAETLATAIAASYSNIPLCHIQGGETTGSIDDRVRNAVTQLADLHLVSTKRAERNVWQMINSEVDLVGMMLDKRVACTGCPSIDLARAVSHDQFPMFDATARYGGVGSDLDYSQPYLVGMQHPVTTEAEQARDQVHETLAALDHSGYQAVWIWPNSDAGTDATSNGIRRYRELYHPKRMRFFKGMSPYDFLKLLKHSKCIVGNSSVALRECSYLGVPAVNVGTRQQGRERAKNVMDASHDQKAIRNAIWQQASRQVAYSSSQLYGDGTAGGRIAEILSAQ